MNDNPTLTDQDNAESMTLYEIANSCIKPVNYVKDLNETYELENISCSDSTAANNDTDKPVTNTDLNENISNQNNQRVTNIIAQNVEITSDNKTTAASCNSNTYDENVFSVDTSGLLPCSKTTNKAVNNFCDQTPQPVVSCEYDFRSEKKTYHEPAYDFRSEKKTCHEPAYDFRSDKKPHNEEAYDFRSDKKPLDYCCESSCCCDYSCCCETSCCDHSTCECHENDESH